ncbi:MAG: hypothetical protein LBE12_07450 [Planctomycetaceae bacterium]|nr:hypothetical protein [Planctomycetaceae bacterium]
MHNRRLSVAQPTDQNLLSFVKAPHGARLLIVESGELRVESVASGMMTV